ncbi:Protein singed [Schistosoma japonicum]|nr:Protein singed [Schistosoma japonicum]
MFLTFVSCLICLDSEERFRLEFAPDGTGEWAFKSDTYGFYLSGSDTQVSCFSKSPVWWSIRLATHPQVHIRHQFRSRYLRLLNDGLELRADQSYPWGPESVIWIEQPGMAVSQSFGRNPNTPLVGKAAVSRLGRVAFRMPNGKYLKPNGEMCDEMDDSTLFSFEYRPGNPGTFAFRDQKGYYLTTIGPGTTKVKTNTNIGKEELFLIEHAALQIGILAHNGKFASVKQGIEISANQHELDETAIFQLEYIGGTGFNALEAVASSTPTSVQLSGQDTGADSSTSNLCLINSNHSITNGVHSTDIYFLTTGFWRLRSRSGKLWKLTPSSGVKNTASDGTSIVFLSSLTGGFLVRGKQNVLDSNGVAYEPFYIHVTKRQTYKFFARNQNSSYSLWAAGMDGSLQLEPTHLTPLDDGDIINEGDDNINDLKYEFQLHFLGHGRVLIQSLNSQRDSISLVKSEIKGDVKLDVPGGGGSSGGCDITANYIWEI